MPSLTPDTWALVFQFSVACILAAFIPRLLNMAYHLLREYID